jgi:4-amino-4-deoxy-L-arabinose transferase-like glycosyltransferase
MDASRKIESARFAELTAGAFIAWLAAVLGIAGTCYALVAAAHPVFGRAEIYFAESARVMLTMHRYVTPYYLGQAFFDKPILSYWAIVAGFEALGLTHFAARLPSLLAALATAALTGYGAARMAGRWAGVAAAAVLCSSYLFAYFATLAMSDMWLTLFMSAGCGLLFAGSVDAERRTLYWWMAAILLSLAFLTKGPVGIVLPAAALLLYLALSRELGQIRWRHAVIALATLGVVAGEWFYFLWRENGTHSLYAFFIEENLLRFGGETYGTDRWFGYIPVSFILGGLPWTLLLPAVAWRFTRQWRDARRRTSREGRAELFLCCYVCVVIAFFWASRMQLDYYILPALPAYAALTGSYLARAVPKGERSARIGAWVLAVTLLLLGAAAGLYLWPRVGGEGVWNGPLLPVWFLATAAAMIVLLARKKLGPAYAMVFLAVCGAGAFGARLGLPAYQRYAPIEEYARAIRQSGDTNVLRGLQVEPAPVAVAIASDLDLWRGELAFQAGRVPRKLESPQELQAFLREDGPRMALVTESWTAALPAELSGRLQVADRRAALVKGVTLATLLDPMKLQANLARVVLVSNGSLSAR